MYSAKGSLPVLRSRSPSISRRQSRWSVLVLIVFAFLLVLNYFPFRFIPLPYPSIPTQRGSCPATPPRPSLTVPARQGLDWRNIKTRYPVEKYAKLPGKRRGSKERLPRIQYDFEGNGTEALYRSTMRSRRQAAVRAVFKRSWRSYKSQAWKSDELRPISGGNKTSFGGWGATLVDSLDTLWLLDMKEEFEEAVEAVLEIDFNPTGTINVFETTIRYLGGLLAAYDVMDCKDTRLLDKAAQLGNMLYASFDTPNRMPITRWDPLRASQGEEQLAASSAIIAELASFSLEFTRLSQLTGDMRYYDAVVRVADVLSEQQNRTRIPGLWPVGIDVRQLDLTQGTRFSLGAMADSAYEYLGKTYQLLHASGSPLVEQYQKMYDGAMSAASQHLLFRPRLPDNTDVLISTGVNAESLDKVVQDYSTQHLTCFVGGMFLLGGRLFSNSSHLEIGRKVTDGCVWAYQHAPQGIMPETLTMNPFDEAGREQQYPGFAHVSDARYLLRPEAIESVFYAYRITGDPQYQDIAWEMFESIETLTRTEYANAAIRNVMKENRTEVEKMDEMESFWLAETLKYFWLIFAEPGVMSLDDWVFSTEAHAFRLVV
ncbi:glycoside hydrolase family 47 protein [Lophiostoma macrostomum CBS 122681]|uniref:alpha-1,2-Mannosidase n=1 Tax=Lophiostoma macrostomum CBS 122681 TaxID=1314788 RepID=A0A6A6T6G1_9PLEO|nr:glycoside hydrolase family 47 protein [Lophiostoma macrostomum CBS 122681]